MQQIGGTFERNNPQLRGNVTTDPLTHDFTEQEATLFGKGQGCITNLYCRLVIHPITMKFVFGKRKGCEADVNEF
jgi:hypothetical protein